MQTLRTCVISRKILEQKDLIQVFISPIWEIKINKSWISWKKWRSIYLQNDKKIIEQFLKRPINFFNNFIKRKVVKGEFESLKNRLLVIQRETECSEESRSWDYDLRNIKKNNF